MSEFVHVVNNTEKRLSMVYDGAAIVFQPQGLPGSLLQLPKAAAEYVKGHLQEQVRIINGASFKSIIEKPKFEVYYVANMSGDPDAAEYWEETFRNPVTGEGEIRKVYNELRHPQSFKARLGRFSGIKPPRTLLYRDGSGNLVWNDKEIQVTLPGQIIEVPAYGRIEVTKEQFETLIGRDLSRPEHLRGQIIRSRAPTDFEPDFNDPKWTIDALRQYLELVPSTGDKMGGRDVMGKSESEIRAENEHMTPTQLAMHLHDVRYKLWARCILRAMDPQFALPSEKEFSLAQARKVKAEKQSKS